MENNFKKGETEAFSCSENWRTKENVPLGAEAEV